MRRKIIHIDNFVVSLSAAIVVVSFSVIILYFHRCSRFIVCSDAISGFSVEKRRLEASEDSKLSIN